MAGTSSGNNLTLLSVGSNHVKEEESKVPLEDKELDKDARGVVKYATHFEGCMGEIDIHKLCVRVRRGRMDSEGEGLGRR